MFLNPRIYELFFLNSIILSIFSIYAFSLGHILFINLFINSRRIYEIELSNSADYIESQLGGKSTTWRMRSSTEETRRENRERKFGFWYLERRIWSSIEEIKEPTRHQKVIPQIRAVEENYKCKNFLWIAEYNNKSQRLKYIRITV